MTGFNPINPTSGITDPSLYALQGAQPANRSDNRNLQQLPPPPQGFGTVRSSSPGRYQISEHNTAGSGITSLGMGYGGVTASTHQYRPGDPFAAPPTARPYSPSSNNYAINSNFTSRFDSPFGQRENETTRQQTQFTPSLHPHPTYASQQQTTNSDTSVKDASTTTRRIQPSLSQMQRKLDVRAPVMERKEKIKKSYYRQITLQAIPKPDGVKCVTYSAGSETRTISQADADYLKKLQPFALRCIDGIKPRNQLARKVWPLAAFADFLLKYHGTQLINFYSAKLYRGTAADPRIQEFKGISDTSYHSDIRKNLTGALAGRDDYENHVALYGHPRDTVAPTTQGRTYAPYDGLEVKVFAGDKPLLGDQKDGYLGWLLDPDNLLHVDTRTGSRKDVNDPLYRDAVIARYHQPVAIFASELRRAWDMSLTMHTYIETPQAPSPQMFDFQSPANFDNLDARSGIMPAMHVFQQYRANRSVQGAPIIQSSQIATVSTDFPQTRPTIQQNPPPQFQASQQSVQHSSTNPLRGIVPQSIPMSETDRGFLYTMQQDLECGTYHKMDQHQVREHKISPLAQFAYFLQKYHGQELSQFSSPTNAYSGTKADPRIRQFKTITDPEITSSAQRYISGALGEMVQYRQRVRAHGRPSPTLLKISPGHIYKPYANLYVEVSQLDAPLLGQGNSSNGYFGWLLNPDNSIHVDTQTGERKDVTDPAYRDAVIARYHRPVAIFASELRRVWDSSLTMHTYIETTQAPSDRLREFRSSAYHNHRAERNGIMDAIQAYQQYRNSNPQ
jgi:hypothetical protein